MWKYYKIIIIMKNVGDMMHTILKAEKLKVSGIFFIAWFIIKELYGGVWK